MIPDRNPPYTWFSVRDHGNPVMPGQKRPRATLSQLPYHDGGSPEARRRAIPRRAHRGWRMRPSTPIPRGLRGPRKCCLTRAKRSGWREGPAIAPASPARAALPVTRVAVALLELAARTARAWRVPAHLGVVDAVPRGAALLGPAARVVARRGVLQPAGPLRPVHAPAREASGSRWAVRGGALVGPGVGPALAGVGATLTLAARPARLAGLARPARLTGARLT
jgi:hypothetical protein